MTEKSHHKTFLLSGSKYAVCISRVDLHSGDGTRDVAARTNGSPSRIGDGVTGDVGGRATR